METTRSFPKSNHVKRMSYDEKRRILEVEFVNNKVYEYQEVPMSIWVEALECTSAGLFLSTKVKGKFEYQYMGNHQD